MRGVVLAGRRGDAGRPGGAGHRPQRARHLRTCCTTAASSWRPSRSRIGFRIEHPQSLIDRARFGPIAGNPLLGAADYRLVHHCRQRPHVYSFCMCPGGTVVAATSRAGPRGDQWHEPVFAQRAQRQCRHRRRHHPRRLSRAMPLAGMEFQRHWESARLCRRRRRLRRRRGSWSGDFLAGRASTALGEVLPSLQARACTPTDLARCLPDFADRRDPRGAAGLRPADRRLRHAGCGADRRRDPHLLADPHRPRRRISRA